MKQDGNVLIVLLILLTVISSSSIELFNLALMGYKAHKHFIKHERAFYQTEACLQKLGKNSALLSQSVDFTGYFQHSLDWWRTHAVQCGENVWYRGQKLSSDDILLSAFHEQHILLQLTLHKDPFGHWKPINWAQLE